MGGQEPVLHRQQKGNAERVEHPKRDQQKSAVEKHEKAKSNRRTSEQRVSVSRRVNDVNDIGILGNDFTVTLMDLRPCFLYDLLIIFARTYMSGNIVWSYYPDGVVYGLEYCE